jgi:hypothetical protein
MVRSHRLLSLVLIAIGFREGMVCRYWFSAAKTWGHNIELMCFGFFTIAWFYFRLYVWPYQVIKPCMADMRHAMADHSSGCLGRSHTLFMLVAANTLLLLSWWCVHSFTVLLVVFNCSVHPFSSHWWS